MRCLAAVEYVVQLRSRQLRGDAFNLRLGLRGFDEEDVGASLAVQACAIERRFKPIDRDRVSPRDQYKIRTPARVAGGPNLLCELLRRNE